MAQGDGLRAYQEECREAMRRRITEGIGEMREENMRITKKALAEVIGVPERTMYLPYITAFLQGFKEFNPGLGNQDITDRSEEFQNEIKSLKAKNKELSVRNRELKIELSNTKGKLQDMKSEYERLLGRYQKEVSEKIVHL